MWQPKFKTQIASDFKLAQAVVKIMCSKYFKIFRNERTLAHKYLVSEHSSSWRKVGSNVSKPAIMISAKSGIISWCYSTDGLIVLFISELFRSGLAAYYYCILTGCTRLTLS